MEADKLDQELIQEKMLNVKNLQLEQLERLLAQLQVQTVSMKIVHHGQMQKLK